MTMWDLVKTRPRAVMWTLWGVVGLFVLIGLWAQAIGGSFWAFAFLGSPCLFLAIIMTIVALAMQPPRRQPAIPPQANPYLPAQPQQQHNSPPPQSSQGSDSMDF